MEGWLTKNEVFAWEMLIANDRGGSQQQQVLTIERSKVGGRIRQI
jgi:hypothetical protein